jgi:SAM-dependent methyltransferase/uncharacterized protein YbaR (Trm112 family)
LGKGSVMSIDRQLLTLLVCPRDRTALHDDGGGRLTCEAGHEFPMVDGVPVLLVDDVAPTLTTEATRPRRAPGQWDTDGATAALHLESLSLSHEEKNAIVAACKGSSRIDPVVQYLVAATCGTAYKPVLGRLSEYPIPEIPLSPGGGLLVDIGCNWGRWSLAAAKRGYRVIGVDPQLGAVLAAKRVGKQCGHEAAWLCADARHLPLASKTVDSVFSYSVLQHFSRADCAQSIEEISRILRPGGVSLVQMANALGARNVYQRVKRGGREPVAFEVRYYRPAALLELFRRIGPSAVSADCFLGLGLQRTDGHLYRPAARAALEISERLKRICRLLPALNLLADSVYVRCVKPS